MTGARAMTGGDRLALIVDDEPDMCWALGHILEGNGIVPITATSRQEALRLVQRQRFDLAFIDAKLPDADGLDLARRIRGENSEIPIVLVSGYFYGDDPDVLRALAAGVISDFLSKPFLHGEVRAIARTLLAP